MSTRVISYDNLDAFGFIPMMLSPTNMTPMWKQVDQGYAHGGGWNDFDGFEVSTDDEGKYMLTYPGDPAYHERGRIVFGDEMLVIFDYSWVLWVHGDEHKIARID